MFKINDLENLGSKRFQSNPCTTADLPRKVEENPRNTEGYPDAVWNRASTMLSSP
jgi:hypothetical protein